MNYTHDDFFHSAKTAIDKHFDYFVFPTKGMFNEDEINHIYEIGASILMTKHGFQPGGSFVHAVVEDKMSLAYSRADSTMLKAMRIMTHVANNVALIKATPGFKRIS